MPYGITRCSWMLCCAIINDYICNDFLYNNIGIKISVLVHGVFYQVLNPFDKLLRRFLQELHLSLSL
jgi:hypothetical protein